MCYRQPVTKSNYSHVTVLPGAVLMTDSHKKIITSNYENLLRLNADNVRRTLFSEGIITLDEHDAIKSEKSSTDKAEALLQLLMRKQDRAFFVLIAALKKYGSPELARILEMAGGMVIVDN